MRRVGVLTSVHPVFDVRILVKECRSLVAAGYDVTLIAPHDREERANGISIKPVPKRMGRLARMTRTVWQVYREAVCLEADLYHFHDPELIPVGLVLRMRGKRVVYDIHEDTPRTVLSKDKEYLPRGAGRPLSWLVERLENSASRHFSALVAATPAIAERFRRLNRKTVVVQNFPLLSEWNATRGVPWARREFAVCYVGGISENRGIREMVEAMGILPESLCPNLKLAGSFSPAELRDNVVKLRGWRKVEELGLLNRAGVASLFAQVRAGLVVLHPEPNHTVSQPNKLFEYMCAGIPVIASDFPLWRQIIESAGCGLLVDPTDVKAIAEAIAYVLTHDEESEAMGRRGRDAVEKRYNWSSEERKLLALYADLEERAWLRERVD